MTKLPDVMPSLLDREIEYTHDDAFGHRHYAKALESLIESSDNVPPFSIGLLGKWGTGKSSIKTIYLKSLKDDQVRANGHTRAERVRAITFNAWRFGGEDIKRALLKQVFCEIGGNKDEITDALYARIQRTVKEPRGWRELLWEAYDKWPWLLLQVLTVTFLLIGSWSAFKILNIKTDWVKMAIAASFAYIFNPKRFMVSRYSNFLRVSEPTTAAEQYEDLLIDQLRKFKNHDGKCCDRLVIFIDDLDRLSADEMVSGLDAIRTFMEMSKLPKGLGIVFIISCDEERVAKALGRRNGVTATPASVITRDDARRFLDRIFQFRLEIPPFPRRDMEAYAKSRLQASAPQILVDLESAGHDVGNIIGRMIHQGVKSPRNALQILNAFVQCWWIARKREQDGAGSDRTGGLAEGAVTKYPEYLAAICALRVDFPDFYGDLEQEPDLITRFTAVFVLENDIQQQPEAIRNILRGYHDDGVLRPQFYPLRQYISSLRSMIPPGSIQPLILLSQDPIMRRFGDNAIHVYDALVSGDTQGVLAALGRDMDANRLGSAESSLIQELEQDLYRESDVKQDNAYSVIVSLSSRLSETTSRQVLTPVARRLIQSAQLRQLVGIAGLEACLKYSAQEERRLIAGELITSVLKTQGDTECRLPSGEIPSLDEAIAIVKATCKLILTVRSKDSLESLDDQHLLFWLLLRRVSINGKEQMLGLNELEEWVAEYEDSLLPDLREGYSELILDELCKETDPDIDVDPALGRCRRVFKLLWEAGEDRRKILYEQLGMCVSSKQEHAVALAHITMQDHLNAPDAQTVSDYFVNFAGRLCKENDRVKGWELTEWQSHYDAFLGQVSERRTSLVGSTVGPNFEVLAISWGSDEEASPYAIRLMDMLVDLDRHSAHNVISKWTDTIFSDLDSECVSWLATGFSDKLSDEERSTAMAAITAISQDAGITEAAANAYQGFIGNLPLKAVQSAEFKGYLQQLLPFVQNQYGSIEYLKSVFPVLPRIIDSCPETELGNMLHVLFTNSQNIIDVFGWLHSQMAGCWPKQSPETGSYDPLTIFNGAHAVLIMYPQHSFAPSILSSIVDLAKREIVDLGQRAAAAQAACLVWPSYPDESLKSLEILEFAPAPSETTNLSSGIDLENENQVDNLAKIWQLISSLFTPEQNIESVRLILADSPKGKAQEPDLCLRLWLHSIPGYESVIRGLLIDTTLSDDQRKRLWLQAIRETNHMGQDFFLQILPIVLQMPDSEATSTSILDSEQQISALFAESTEERRELGLVLLRALVATPSQTITNRIATWLHKLKVPGVLKELKGMDGVNETDIEALRSVFGNSGYMRKLSGHLKDL